MLGSNNKFRSALLGTAAVALMGAAGTMVTSKDANATAYAYAAIEVSNFTVSGTGAGFTGFDTFKFVEKGMSVNLNGATDSTSSTISQSAGTNLFPSLDEDPICVGDCGTLATNTNVYSSGASKPTNPIPGPAPQGSFSLADMHMLSTQVAGGNSGEFGGQAGAQGSGGQFSISTVSTDQELQWNFTLTADTVLTFDWDHIVTLEASVSEDGESATGNVGYRIVVTNEVGTAVFDDDDLIDGDDTVNLSSLAPAGTTLDFSSAVTGDTVSTGTLAAGQYSLQVFFDTTANVQSVNVPEPGALALLGVGLMGLGFAGYRRRKQV